MKLIPEVQKIVAPTESCLCDGKGIIHRTYYYGWGHPLDGDVEKEQDEPCEVCAERETLALAIQEATARRCAEIAEQKYQLAVVECRESAEAGDPFGRDMSSARASAFKATHAAIRTEFHLGE